MTLCIELEQPKRLRLILDELLTTGPVPVATAEEKRTAVVNELVRSRSALCCCNAAVVRNRGLGTMADTGVASRCRAG